VPERKQTFLRILDKLSIKRYSMGGKLAMDTTAVNKQVKAFAPSAGAGSRLDFETGVPTDMGAVKARTIDSTVIDESWK